VGAHRISCEVVEVVEGEDPGGEEPEGLESLLVGYAERSGDALGGEVEEGLCGGRWLGEEGFGGGLEPEHALEAALGVEGSVEELGYEGMGLMAWGLVQDELALGVEALEGVVSCGTAVFPEGLGDFQGFVFLGEVTGDAQEVAAFGAGAACGCVQKSRRSRWPNVCAPGRRGGFSAPRITALRGRCARPLCAW